MTATPPMPPHGVLVGPLLDTGAVGAGEGVDVQHLAAVHGDEPVVGAGLDRRGLRIHIRQQEERHE
jgi:hypothetical protein